VDSVNDGARCVYGTLSVVKPSCTIVRICI
jgi:hypothetical protein